MSDLNFRQLIDLAIGSPEPGHVNFYALHCVLVSFAEKLNIIEEKVDKTNFDTQTLLQTSSKSINAFHHKGHKEHRESHKRSRRSAAKTHATKRMTGGGDDDKETAPVPPTADNDAQATEAAPAPTAETVVEEPQLAAADDAAAEEVPPIEIAEQQEESAVPAVDEEPQEQQEELGASTSAVLTAAPASARVSLAADVTAKASRTSAERLSLAAATSQRDVVQVQSVGSYHTAATRDTLQYTASIAEMGIRLATVENVLELPNEMPKGVSIMKDQLELAMEQLQMVTALTILNQGDFRKTEYLRQVAEQLQAISKDNIYVESANNLKLVHRSASGRNLDEPPSEHTLQTQQTVKAVRDLQQQQTDFSHESYDMDLHLSYTPEKMLSHLLEMKTEFCTLTNKVNDLAANLLEQDCQHTLEVIKEMQEDIRNISSNTAGFKESLERIETKQQRDADAFSHIEEAINTLKQSKPDRTEVELLLADKVDYIQLQRKVSHDELNELKCCTEKKFCLVQKIFDENERNIQATLEEMRKTLGPDTVTAVLNKFKDKIDGEMKMLQKALREYVEMTNDDCAAAGARVKVLQDLACISCDTTCVMRTIEKSKVAKLPNAHAQTSMLRPLITYELGSIRKSGIMGYYRKDEFPHSPNSWIKGAQATLKMCVPRHAGGNHTTHTADEVVQKVMLQRK